MAEYASLKVPELKKLLAEKKLPQTGNKADLIARLQEDDEKNARPTSIAKPASAARGTQGTSAPSRAPPAASAVTAPPQQAPTQAAGRAPSSAPPSTAELAEQGGSASKIAKSAAEPAIDDTNPEAKPAEPAFSFALGLSATPADEEAKKRAERAKRFGMEEDDDTKKRAERAQRFGIDSHDLATGLDAALPERPAKRARGRDAADDARRPKKRHNMDRKGGRAGRGGGKDARASQPRPRTNGPATKGSVLDNPIEKAKAEKRAARFAAG